MAVYRTICPHCFTRNVAFESATEWQIPRQDRRRALFLCGNCSEGIIVSFLPGISSSLSQVHNIEDAHILVVETWPALPSSDAPEHTPETVSRYYKQAIESLQSGHFDAAGIMFRKVLETSSRELLSSASKPLISRIDALADGGLITSDMKDWAHQIRLGGNQAAHDDAPYSKDDAARLAAFADAFLKYAYTLPALVRAGTKNNEGR